MKKILTLFVILSILSFNAFAGNHNGSSNGNGNQNGNGNGGNGNHYGWNDSEDDGSDPGEVGGDPDAGESNVPFDDYVPILVIAAFAYGFYANRKNRFTQKA